MTLMGGNVLLNFSPLQIRIWANYSLKNISTDGGHGHVAVSHMKLIRKPCELQWLGAIRVILFHSDGYR